MDHFLTHSGPVTNPGTVPAQPPSESQTVKMADSVALRATGSSALHAAAEPVLSEEVYDKIAQAVATLLSPTITLAVDRAITAGIDQFHSELREHASRLSEAENRISVIEGEIQSSHTESLQAFKTQQYILEKLDDLENRSRRNNLHIIGLPETYNS